MPAIWAINGSYQRAGTSEADLENAIIEVSPVVSSSNRDMRFSRPTRFIELHFALP